MTDTIEDLKRQVRARLPRGFLPVQPKTQASQKKHLEVWETNSGKTRFIGFEFGRTDFLNIWLATMNVPADLPETIKRTDKIWEGGRHVGVGEDTEGTNSNLKGYDAFRGKKVTRLAVTTLADAEMIMEHLTQ